MKFTDEIKNKLADLHASGQYNIKDICQAIGISRDTYYKWKKTNKAFAAEIKKAETHRLDSLKEMALSGLAVLLMGKEWEEVTIEYDAHGKIKSKKTVTRSSQPNPLSVIFTLKSRDSDNFQDIIHQHMTGNVAMKKPDWVTEEIKPPEELPNQ